MRRSGRRSRCVIDAVRSAMASDGLMEAEAAVLGKPDRAEAGHAAEGRVCVRFESARWPCERPMSDVAWSRSSMAPVFFIGLSFFDV